MSKRPIHVPLIIGATAVGSLLFLALFVARLLGWVIPFSVPNNSMAPTIIAGDHVLMEGFTPRRHPPARGEVIVFSTAGLPFRPTAQPNERWIKRVVGLPGERVRIQSGKLYINDAETSVLGKNGPVVFADLPSFTGTAKFASHGATFTIPPGAYFVIGDNAANSYDSRSWGGLPVSNIIGRVTHCYWPPSRAGGIR